MNIILCGYKSCGKTTVGKAFSQKYQTEFIDTDDLIINAYTAKESVHNIREIHQALGDARFRELETQAIHSIRDITDAVIATGGGCLTSDENIKHLKSLGKIIYLYADPALLYERMFSLKSLPSFIDPRNSKNDFQRYIDKRMKLYDSVADYLIDTTDKTIDQIVCLLNECRLQ